MTIYNDDDYDDNDGDYYDDNDGDDSLDKMLFFF